MDKNLFEIALNDSEPIYRQIAEGFKRKIQDGDWKEGDKIPSEEQLVNLFNVSRGTIRKAINILVEESILSKSHGKGTFVSKDKISYPFAQELSSYAESMKNMNMNYSTTVIEKKIVRPTPFLQEKLNISELSNVLYLVRVRKVEDEPAILLRNWISLERCPDIDKVDFSKVSLFEAVEKNLQDKLKYGVRDFSAKLLNDKEAKLLFLRKNDPVLCLDQVTFDKNDKAVECSNVLLRTDQYQVTSVLYR